MNRKDPFLNNYLYHIYNRGTDKRSIFLSKKDYERFLYNLENFNKLTPANQTSKTFANKIKGKEKPKKENSPIVKIHYYCLMPNHYHLVIEQLADGGVSKFLQKVITGYTMYFNLLHKRSGVLFQGRTKSKLIDTDEYKMWLEMYFALNPLDLHDQDWKTKGIKNIEASFGFLKGYKWHSDFNYEEIDLEGFLKDLHEGNFLPF